MESIKGHTILLGGVGGDSHSIGMTILRQALTMNGYRVLYLGIQNELEEFFRLAHFCNAVMISSLDGHARYYLSRFPELMKQYQRSGQLWYLGGNLTTGDAFGYEDYFLNMGFNRVFVKFVNIRTLLEVLEQDLRAIEPISDVSTIWQASMATTLPHGYAIPDEDMSLEIFRGTRVEVLNQWTTGQAALHIEDNAAFLSRQPSFARAQALVNSGRLPMLIQPRIGFALISEQVKTFNTFKRLGAQVLSYQVDSLTRNHNFVGAEEALRDSKKLGQSTINGFPVINHGVEVLRRIIKSIGTPLQTRHSSRDPRLLAEISFAGGVTSFEGGSISYNVPYYKNYALSESIHTWQYIDRLVGLYYERFGIVLDREFFGVLTGTLIPPCIAIVSNILEAIMAIQHGVKSVSLGYAEQGHRIQDVAAISTMRRMASEIIQNLGYKDVQINTVFHQYMAAFPNNLQQAEELICNSAVTAELSGATRVIIKTPVESYKIPSITDNIHALGLVMRSRHNAASQYVDDLRITEESMLIRREVEAIFDSLIMCGKGSIVKGIVNGFQKGYIDIPFAPSIYNKGAVMTVRDIEGAVRFLSIGNLAFDQELRQFHAEKARERRLSEGLLAEQHDYFLIERDVLQIPSGEYDRWPLFS